MLAEALLLLLGNLYLDRIGARGAFPRRAIKRLRAIRNASVSMLLRRSTWTALVVIHFK
uniref:Immediate early response 3-interacting protein 1 n=1 Tax=Anguilla anguilla TaxID=7936 RepID=A0A0E9UB67_ANGAN